MKILNVSLCEESVDFSQFHDLDVSKAPYTCIGIRIMNKFDQERIKFNKQYKADNVMHWVSENNMPSRLCLKALPLKHDAKFDSLIKQLNQNVFNNLNTYKNILGEFGLSCDECHKFFTPGVYPIDGKHTSVFFEKPIQEMDLYKKVLDIKTISTVQCFGYFAIFILTRNFHTTESGK